MLLTCSAADTSMILWNTASENMTPIRRIGGGGESSLIKDAIDVTTMDFGKTPDFFRRAHGLVVVGRAVRAGGDAVQGVPRVGHPTALEPRALERPSG